MSLDLSAFDDAALEALAPKGVVRRARRDQEAGLARIEERSNAGARIVADGETVKIDTRGPKAAQCTCPAGGVCRHVLLAVMALNAEAPAPEASEPAGPTALEELCALTQAELERFAGADWADAIALAGSSSNSNVEIAGRNCTIEFDGAPASVTFLAGQGLKGAAFKGPRTRARIVIAAAAILARQKNQIPLSRPAHTDDEPAPSQGVSVAFLDEAAVQLARCVRMVLASGSPVAADTLFDLAISARADSAPRLTAHLRTLTRMAVQASQRIVQYEPEAFLTEAARAYALLQALRRAPADPAFTGVVRRDYQPAPPCTLWMLGAVRWTSESGARGLTMHAFCPDDRQWRSVTQARAAGQDHLRSGPRLPVALVGVRGRTDHDGARSDRPGAAGLP